MTFLYVLSLAAIVQGIVSLIDGYRAARHMRRYRPGTIGRERAVVFCPCKGIDEGFEKNIRSVLDQDYPDFEVRFVVESREDPAWTALSEMGIGNILVAGRAMNRGQKVHNLAYAVASLLSSPDRLSDGLPEIYVFCDSDARYPRHWMSSLLSPLSRGSAGMDSSAGAPAETCVTTGYRTYGRSPRAPNRLAPAETCVTTGYRWYVAGGDSFPALLRSAWNASVVSMLGSHNRNFAWGGSMALRRETFDSLRILDAWQGSVSDDYAVTRAAQRAAVPVLFVPECLVPSHGGCTWRDLIEFTTRQITITRVYHPGLWRAGFAGQVIFNTAFYGMLFVQPQVTAGLFFLAIWKSAVRLSAVQSVLPDPGLLKFSWFYILSSPLVGLIYLYNMIRSALGTDIVWRKVHYRLISPNETLVLGGSGASADLKSPKIRQERPRN